MAKKHVTLEKMVIPTHEFEADDRIQADKMRIKGLADATHSETSYFGGKSYCQLPQLKDVDYRDVKVVALSISGSGFGSIAYLSKENFEKMKRKYGKRSNNAMIGAEVIALYRDGPFTGFAKPKFSLREVENAIESNKNWFKKYWIKKFINR